MGAMCMISKRQIYFRFLNFGMIVSSALMIWKGLMVITGCESPILLVYNSEGTFNRGDVLLVTNYKEDSIRVGEIVVFRIEGRDVPIIHRVFKVHERPDGRVKFLTKGDKNALDDRGLYSMGQLWLEKKDIVGRDFIICWTCSAYTPVTTTVYRLFLLTHLVLLSLPINVGSHF